MCLVLSTDLKGHNLKVMGILFTKRVSTSIIFILLLYYYIRKTVMALQLFYGGRHGVMILAVNALIVQIQKPSPGIWSNEDDQKPSEIPHFLKGCRSLSISLGIMKFDTYPDIGHVFGSVTRLLSPFNNSGSVSVQVYSLQCIVYKWAVLSV